MAMGVPLVTLGVASYNNAPYIRATLDSIRDLHYPHVQVIVVDDASTDESVAVITQWMQDNTATPIQFEQHPVNAGICTVLSRVLDLAQGEFLAFIGSDDIWRPSFLRELVTVFVQLGPDYGLVYGDIVRIDEEGRILDERRPEQPASGFPEGEVFVEMLRGNFIPAMAQLTRTAVVREIGGFDKNLSYEDWDLWLRLARSYKFKYVPVVVAEYRIHKRSAMRNLTRYRLLVESTIDIVSKHWGVSKETDQIISVRFARLAQELYEVNSFSARKWLLRSWRWQPTARHTLYTILSGLGIPFTKLLAAKQRLTGSR